MVDPFSLLLLGQAIKVLSVPAGAAWKGFAEQLGSTAGGAAADKVTRWLVHGGDPDGLAESDVDEMRSDPAAATALSQRLEAHLGVPLSPAHAAPSTLGSSDSAIVSGYEAVLWRVAALAYLEDRPIVIDGALQGSDWLTACIPTPVFSKPHQLPDPARFWSSSDSPPRRERDDFALAEYYSRRILSDGRPAERDRLNLSFRRSGREGFPPDDPATPLLDRWHRIDGFEATWVLLEPDSAAQGHMIRAGASYADLERRQIGIDSYPPDWLPLLEIPVPDDLTGLKALGSGADAFAAQSKAVVARVKNALEMQQSL